MIYLDCAATSLQKPAAVGMAAGNAVRALASPGRGGYPAAMDAADVLLDCRTELAGLFSVSDPARVVFTSCATHGLNIAIRSLVSPGDRVVVTGYEHNAVIRPLHALGADIYVAASPLFDPDAAAEAFRRGLRGAKAAVCCHVSNVFGAILPLGEIAAMCRAADVPLIVDASQSAGGVPLDFDGTGAAFAAMPGHKGLLGPQGTGVLLVGENAAPAPLIHGGTGSESELPAMPPYLPDRLEAGTHNMPGVAGLLEGVRWVRRRGAASVLRRETRLRALAAGLLGGRDGLQIFTAPDGAWQSGVLSLRFSALDCEEAARRLARRGIAVRAGLHCAPLAHRTAGTLGTGTVRLSFSPFTTERDVRTACAAVVQLLK